MSYREDFIALTQAALRARPNDPTLRNFANMARAAQRATVIRMRGDQSTLFLDTPVDETQDWRQWLRLPYPYLYIHPESPFPFHDYDHGIDHDLAALRADPDADPEELQRLEAIHRVHCPLVRGVTLSEGTRESLGLKGVSFDPGAAWPTDADDVDLTRHGHLIERAILVNFLMPLPGFDLNAHTLSMIVLTDGRLVTTNPRAQVSTRSRMRQWAIHIINFLSSPTIKLVRNDPDVALQKARARRGKPPLEGWYEITYRHQVGDYTRNKIAPGRWQHAYRYDVRGHFRRYENGRIVWIPPHQRGLRNALYKPKGYRTEAARPV